MQSTRTAQKAAELQQKLDAALQHIQALEDALRQHGHPLPPTPTLLLPLPEASEAPVEAPAAKRRRVAESAAAAPPSGVATAMTQDGSIAAATAAPAPARPAVSSSSLLRALYPASSFMRDDALEAEEFDRGGSDCTPVVEIQAQQQQGGAAPVSRLASTQKPGAQVSSGTSSSSSGGWLLSGSYSADAASPLVSGAAPAEKGSGESVAAAVADTVGLTLPATVVVGASAARNGAVALPALPFAPPPPRFPAPGWSQPEGLAAAAASFALPSLSQTISQDLPLPVELAATPAPLWPPLPSTTSSSASSSSSSTSSVTTPAAAAAAGLAPTHPPSSRPTVVKRPSLLSFQPDHERQRGGPPAQPVGGLRGPQAPGAAAALAAAAAAPVRQLMFSAPVPAARPVPAAAMVPAAFAYTLAVTQAGGMEAEAAAEAPAASGPDSVPSAPSASAGVPSQTQSTDTDYGPLLELFEQERQQEERQRQQQQQ